MVTLASRDISDTDLQISVPVVATGLGVSALVLLAFTDFMEAPSQVTGFGLLGLLGAGLIWLADVAWPKAARWIAVSVVTGSVLMAVGWLAVPGALALLALPIVLSVALIGSGAGAIVALGESILLFLPVPGFVSQVLLTRLFLLIGLWTSIGALHSLSGGLRQLERRVREYLWNSRQLTEEARDRRQELGQAMEDLTNLNRQLVLANERSAMLRRAAEEAELTKAAFVATVSHELRTPLNMIIGLVGLMVDNPFSYDGPVPRDLMEDLRIVHRNSEHLMSMINDVLDLSQVEAGRLTLYYEMVNVTELISTVSEAVQPLVQKKGLSLEIRVPCDLPEVNCDRVRIRQVLLNLVSNAARFTEEGGITIEVERQAGSVVVRVSDTGPGMAPDVAARVFEPFYRGDDPERHSQGGSGLGLSISRQFARLHGGRIWLDSVAGQGSTFYFELPVSRPPALEPRLVGRIREDWVWRERAFHTGRVGLPEEPLKPPVVVYDETGDFGVELKHLFPDADIVLTTDLATAKLAVDGGTVRVVLVNAADNEELPVLMDEAREVMPNTPLVGCSVPHRLERAYQAGARGYLIKPVRPADLARTMRSLGPVRRVLVIDDSLDTLRLMARSLHALDGHLEVVTASNAEEGLASMRSRRPDLVLLDLVMPGMDGWQFLEHKRMDVDVHSIPVVLISAHDPMAAPRTSSVFWATHGDGLTLSQLFRGSLGFSDAIVGQGEVLRRVP